MYTPPPFRSEESWLEMLRRHAFGVLVTSVDGELHTTHLPYAVSEDGRTVAMHVARPNPHWKAIEREPRCRFVVQGEHAYVSPAWYETSESVPTWNYEAVHVDGTAALVHDADALWALVGELTARFEAPDSPWRRDALSPRFRRAMLSGIVGIRLAVAHGEAKQKLSQNRSAAERRRVADELRRRGEAGMADAMERLGSD